MSYKISVGSRAKGYATPDSDDDYILFKASSKKQYLEYFTQVKLLQNCVRNKGTADEYTESDLLFDLRGIYLGNYPHLFIFGNTANIPNKEILKFVKQVGNLRLKPILKNLVNFALTTVMGRSRISTLTHNSNAPLNDFFSRSRSEYLRSRSLHTLI